MEPRFDEAQGPPYLRTNRKANVTLPGGLVVAVEGRAEEVRRVIEKLGSWATRSRSIARDPGDGKRVVSHVATEPTPVDLSEVVRAIKESEEFERYEQHILNRSRQLERVLLALYPLNKIPGGATGLTSGEISRVCAELGVRISQPNASGVLSGIGARYVIGNRTRMKGQPVRYRLTGRGVQYIESVLRG